MAVGVQSHLAPRLVTTKKAVPTTQDRKLGFPVIALAGLLTSYFYVLPFGRYSVSTFTTDFRLFDFTILAFVATVVVPYRHRLAALVAERGSYHRVVVLLIAIVWLSLLMTYATSGVSKFLPGVIRAARFSAYLLTASWVVMLANTPTRARFIARVLLVNIAVQATLALLQTREIIPNLWPTYWQSYGDYPVGTLSPHHKHIGVVMLLGTGMCLGLLHGSRRFLVVVGLVCVIAMTLVVPVLSGSRTAWLGLGTLFAAHALRQRLGGIHIILVVAGGLVLAYFAGGDWLIEAAEDQFDRRFMTAVEEGTPEEIYSNRTQVYFENIPRAIERTPWILVVGTGFQNIGSVASVAAHNNYLQAWMELGLIGLIIYLTFLFRILKTLNFCAHHADTQAERSLAIGGWATFVGVLATMLVGESLWAQYSMFTLTGQIMAVVGVATAFAGRRALGART